MSVYLNGEYDENAEPQGFETIPAGEYPMQIINAEKVSISRQNDYGECLNLTWEVMGGDYNRRLVFQRLNLWGKNMNKNEMVVQIANSQFAEIRQATGVLTPRDTDELLFIPCLVRVAITQDKNKEYDPRNEVKKVKETGNQSPQSTGTPARGSPPQADAAVPWVSNGAQSAARAVDDVPF